MFKDGFHNAVDIYPLKYDNSRNNANNGSFDTANIVFNIPCRIRANDDFKETKVFFEPNTEIQQGYGIYDKQNKMFYTVTNVKKVYSFDKVEHITCEVQKALQYMKILVGDDNG